MTEQQVRALLELINAVDTLGNEPAARDNSPAENRMFCALMMVQACGADVALQMPALTATLAREADAPCPSCGRPASVEYGGTCHMGGCPMGADR